MPSASLWPPLLDIAEKLSLAQSIDDVADVLRLNARALIGADGITLVLRDGDQCHYFEEDAVGPLWKGRRFPLANCISGWAMTRDETVIIPDIYKDSRIPISAYRPTFVKSLVMTPVRRKDPLAAIGAYWAEVREPSVEEVATLEALARAVAVSMSNIQLISSLNETQAKLNVALDAGALGPWECDLPHRALQASAAFAEMATGKSGAKLTYEAFVGAVRADDRSRLDLAFAAAGRGADFNLEVRLPQDSGEERRLLLRGRTLEAQADGRPQRIVGVAIDVTDQPAELHRMHFDRSA